MHQGHKKDLHLVLTICFSSFKKVPFFCTLRKNLNNCRLYLITEIGVEIRKSRILVVMFLQKNTIDDVQMFLEGTLGLIS